MADTESPPRPPPPPSSSEETHSPPVPPPPPPPTEDNNNSNNNKGNTWNWNTYTADDLKRTVVESTDSAIRSARSLHENSSTHIQTVQDLIPKVKSQYTSYEHTFFKKVKDELMSAREHPVVAGGVAIATVLLLMRGPRRFLFRQTFGRLQSEEAQFNKFERSVTNLSHSVDTLKQESTKLLERAALAEEEMKRGHTKVLNAGSQIQRLAKSVYKVESQACDLMDSLREIPGRGALKLRAEVASMASLVKQQRVDLEKRIEKISDIGVPV